MLHLFLVSFYVKKTQILESELFRMNFYKMNQLILRDATYCYFYTLKLFDLKIHILLEK